MSALKTQIVEIPQALTMQYLPCLGHMRSIPSMQFTSMLASKHPHFGHLTPAIPQRVELENCYHYFTPFASGSSLSLVNNTQLRLVRRVELAHIPNTSRRTLCRRSPTPIRVASSLNYVTARDPFRLRSGSNSHLRMQFDWLGAS